MGLVTFSVGSEPTANDMIPCGDRVPNFYAGRAVGRTLPRPFRWAFRKHLWTLPKMSESDFDILSCSWPRPVQVFEAGWASEPDWLAPLMPAQPVFRTQTIDGVQCRAVNWREMFEAGLKFWEPRSSGEMRGFHIVFKIRINKSGTLSFWSDDGCVIRRGLEIIHSDHAAHTLTRSQIQVEAGERLEIAQWQHGGDWIWAARVDQPENAGDMSTSLLRYLGKAQSRLRDPNGPPLKMYFSGQSPIRSALAVYSMLLNGYAPSEVLIFGEYQWSDESRRCLAALLPFARIVPTAEVLRHIESAGQPRLMTMARDHWFVMKLCVGLLCPPDEFCFMDDDVFILDPIDEALRAFEKRDLVYAPDADYAETYMSAWRCLGDHYAAIQTGAINTGLYCLRNSHDRRSIAENLMRVRVEALPGWMWEQGFMACEFAGDSSYQLPSQRYFYPYFDGLPGGLPNYDYASNPCGFVSIHFGGLAEKPSDALSLALAPEILGRRE
jgi:hypothetical protein